MLGVDGEMMMFPKLCYILHALLKTIFNILSQHPNTNVTSYSGWTK